MRGVVKCIVGYSGGLEVDPTYSEMKDYTESLLVEFDPSVVSYQQILAKWKSLSSPYPSKKQYRTAVFFLGAKQEETAKELCAGMKDVDVEPATQFYMAEERHQHFLARL